MAGAEYARVRRPPYDLVETRACCSAGQSLAIAIGAERSCAHSRNGVDPAATAPDERAPARADGAAAGPALAAALAVLTAEERDVLLLYAWEQLDGPEIAAALSIAPGTVKSRLHRARARVCQSLAAAGELDPLRPENHG